MPKPALSTNRSELVAKLLELSQSLSAESTRFHQAVAATFGLGITDMRAISLIVQAGSLSAGQLADRLGLTTGAITSVIDRLEQQDLVQRKRDEADRRKILVVPNLHKILDGSNPYRSIGEKFVALLDGFSTEELRTITRFHERAIGITTDAIDELARSR